MLAKGNRLTVSELKNVGRFSLYRGEYFDAKVLEKYQNKYAVIISAKTYKKAVERNKVKRLFYRILQEQVVKSESFTRVRQKSLLFYPKKKVLETQKEKTVEEIIHFLHKI